MWLIDKLFGNDKVIEKGMDGIDKAFYTDEEKSDAKRAFLKLYEPYKLAQRYIALIFAPPYALAWFLTFIASFFRDVARQEALLSGDIGKIVFVIVGFYFLGGASEGVVRQFRSGSK